MKKTQYFYSGIVVFCISLIIFNCNYKKCLTVRFIKKFPVTIKIVRNLNSGKSTAIIPEVQNISPLRALFLTSREIIGTDDETGGTLHQDISEPTGDSKTMKVECNYGVTYILR
jgi:hypothetical protein